MIQTTEWYQEALKNSESCAMRDKQEIEQLQKRLNELEKRNQFRKIQIEEAIKQGKKEFDADRFCRNKRPLKELNESKNQCSGCGSIATLPEPNGQLLCETCGATWR